MSVRKIVRSAVLAAAVAAPLAVGAGSAQAATPTDPTAVACPSPDGRAGCAASVDDLNIGSQSTGAGAGRVTFNPFSIHRKIDRSSP